MMYFSYIRWVGTFLLGLLGLALVFAVPISGILVLLSAVTLSPPINQKIKPILGAQYLSPILLVAGLAMIIVDSNIQSEQRRAELAAREAAQQGEKRQQVLAELAAKKQQFLKQRDSILADLEGLFSDQQYQAVVTQGDKYTYLDADVKRIVNQAQKALKQAADEKKTQETLAELERTDESDHSKKERLYRLLEQQHPDVAEYKKKRIYHTYEKRIALKKIADEKKTQETLAELDKTHENNYKKNESLYKTLVQLNPDVIEYQDKLADYALKVKEANDREIEERNEELKRRALLLQKAQERVAKFGKKPVKSAWDGSYFPVTHYLKRVAHDPDSIKIINCTEARPISEGWLVGCDYRGKNAFGALIKQSHWFVIRRNAVVEKYEASAFN